VSTLLRDLMTSDPIVLDVRRSVEDAAATMRDEDIGDVLVSEDGVLCGMLTDRDIVARVVAAGRDPSTTPLGSVCSREVHVLGPDDTVEDAVMVLRDHAVRRIPVVDGDTAVGIVSIGDLAVSFDPGSALADVSAAGPND
jgi:CBS domain-containing protein